MKLEQRLRTRLEEGHADDMRILPGDTHDPRVDDQIVHAPAAVLIAVTDRPEPGLILTQRASNLRKHAGQVAFPGGRIDANDADPIAAALREAEEEIALPPQHVRIIGQSDRYKTFTGFDIVPVLGIIPPDLPLVPHEHEVETVFEVPLDHALDLRNWERVAVEFNGAPRHYYESWWRDYRIWGVTAAILVNLSRRLRYDGGRL